MDDDSDKNKLRRVNAEMAADSHRSMRPIGSQHNLTAAQVLCRSLDSPRRCTAGGGVYRGERDR